MNRTPPEVALDRVLAGLAPELVDATDEEIEQAAQDLGMNVRMKGSAAFIGVTYTFPRRLEDIFEMQTMYKAYLDALHRPSLPGGGRKGGEDEE
jgi:hypothetical protein